MEQESECKLNRFRNSNTYLSSRQRVELCDGYGIESVAATHCVPSGTRMRRFLSIQFTLFGLTGLLWSSGLFAQSAALSDAKAFLEKAAEGQQIGISLGQLATERAVNQRVKEFGQQLVDDHKKASQQIEQLAMKEGVQLSPGLGQEYKQNVNSLAQLSGHAFDREYMNYILEDHDTTVDEFQRRVKTMQSQDIKQWIISILPTLQSHREKARQVKYSLQTNP